MSISLKSYDKQPHLSTQGLGVADKAQQHLLLGKDSKGEGAGKDSEGAGKASEGAGKDSEGAGKDSEGSGKDSEGAGKVSEGIGKASGCSLGSGGAVP